MSLSSAQKKGQKTRTHIHDFCQRHSPTLNSEKSILLPFICVLMHPSTETTFRLTLTAGIRSMLMRERARAHTACHDIDWFYQVDGLEHRISFHGQTYKMMRTIANEKIICYQSTDLEIIQLWSQRTTGLYGLATNAACRSTKGEQWQWQWQ